MTKEKLLQLLKEQNVIVTFTKKDGTERRMVCTLAEDIIPEDLMPKSETPRIRSEDLVTVFDIENEGWRSFNMLSVLSIETVGGITV